MPYNQPYKFLCLMNLVIISASCTSSSAPHISPLVMQLDYITTRVAPVLNFWLTFWQTDSGTGRQTGRQTGRRDERSKWTAKWAAEVAIKTCCCSSWTAQGGLGVQGTPQSCLLLLQSTWKLCEYDLCGQSAVISWTVWVEVAQCASMGSSTQVARSSSSSSSTHLCN